MTFRSAYDATLEYIRRVLVGFDMFCNTITGGEPGDTISYRSAVAQSEGREWGCLMCDFLNLFQKNHCGLTLEADDNQRLLWGEAVARGQHPL